MLKKFLRAAARPLLARTQVLLTGHLQDVRERQQELALLLGRMHAARVTALPDRTALRQAEFKVFSQWGEDGIIQYLLSKVEVRKRFFIEFGVENYRESNTRFLIQQDNWSGLVIDGSEAHVSLIRSEALYWRYDLTAAAAFVTAENINDLIRPYVNDPDIGLLSIDIDGNDYWVWKTIDVVTPRIVICEYNSLFGCERAVTVPYRSDFLRTRAHHSNLFWGASLPALCMLAEQKGYAFAGSNSAGNNAFFVRRDLTERILTLSAQKGYVESRFRESRDASGALTYVSGDERLRLIEDMELWDVVANRLVPVGEAFADRFHRLEG